MTQRYFARVLFSEADVDNETERDWFGDRVINNTATFHWCNEDLKRNIKDRKLSREGRKKYRKISHKGKCIGAPFG